MSLEDLGPLLTLAACLAAGLAMLGAGEARSFRRALGALLLLLAGLCFSLGAQAPAIILFSAVIIGFQAMRHSAGEQLVPLLTGRIAVPVCIAALLLLLLLIRLVELPLLAVTGPANEFPALAHLLASRYLLPAVLLTAVLMTVWLAPQVRDEDQSWSDADSSEGSEDDRSAHPPDEEEPA